MPRNNVVSLDMNRFAGLHASNLTTVEQDTLVKLALQIMEARHQPGKRLENPDDTRRYLRLKLADRPNEVFGCLFLDSRCRIIDMRELFQGTLDGASIHPRVVVQQTLESNAAAVVFYHNHPSGVAESSMADQSITRRLKDALALIDVRVLDHFVVSACGSVSFAERGLM